ncbi:multidrug effflux MFS transporter [Photobacterium makurazakiensis]|uniref:multidrug effflux MFS transporter n=1 Tax=Photobacterium makurazakiensis TaxID=2910234 RepID=UPI003D11B75F
MNERLNWRPILLACLIISIGQLSMGLVFPSLPMISESFSISIDEAQLLIAVYLLGFGPSQFLYGPLSDALGRRTILLSGLILALVGLTVTVLGSSSFEWLVFGRFIQGIGTGCCAVLARASVRDSYSGGQLPHALSYITMVASFTPIFAPVIGGFINHYFGWLAVFIVLLSYIGIIWMILYFSFGETMLNKSAVPSIKKVLGDYKSLLSSSYFLSFASVSWLNFSLVVTAISLMPFVMQNQIGMESDEYALWALIPACGMLLGSFLCNKVRPKIGIQRMLASAPAIHVLSAIWLITMPLDPLFVMIGQFLMAMGNGIALPCAQSKLMMPFKNKAGTVAALAGGGQMIISSLMSMALLKLGLSQAWHLGVVIGVFALITSINIHRGFKSEPPVQVA